MKRVLDSCVKAVINGSGHGEGSDSLICVNELRTASRAKSQPPDITDGQEILDADDDSTATPRKKSRLGLTNQVGPPSSESILSQGPEDISNFNKAAKDVEGEGHPSATVNLSVIHGAGDISLAQVPVEEQFPYEALDTSKLEIRVITLHPGTQTNEICCSLTHIATNKGSKPFYKALSYTWGSPESPKTIILNDVRVQVRENLWQALYHLRFEDQELTIWIDALCINQNDLQERSSQVSRMSAIYGLAKEVIVWLGPASDESELAMNFLERKFYPHKGPRTKDIPLAELLHESSEAEIRATASLMAREYWHRVWIIQEIFRARLVTLHCGHDTLKWSNLSRFFRYLARQPELHYLQQSSWEAKSTSLLDCCSSPAKSLTEHRTSQTHCLEDLLVAYKGCHSSDPRDKVYALIGLSQRKVRPISVPVKKGDDWILVDYTKSTVELFLNLVQIHKMAPRADEEGFWEVAWMQLLQEVLDLKENVHTNQTMKNLSVPQIASIPYELNPISCIGFNVLGGRLPKASVASSPPWDPLLQEYGHILQWLQSIEWFDNSPHARNRLEQILHHFSKHEQGRVKRFGDAGSAENPPTTVRVSVRHGGTFFVLAPFPLDDDSDIVYFLRSDIVLVVRGGLIVGRAVLYKMSGPLHRTYFVSTSEDELFFTEPRFYDHLPPSTITLSIEDWVRVVSVGNCPTSK